MKPPFGAAFRELRQRRATSTYALASLTGLNTGYLSRMEAGNFTPGPDNLRRLATALSVDYDDLLALTGRERPPLPRLRPYLRAAYGLSDQNAADVERYVAQYYGVSAGPRDGEDEIDDIDNY